MLGRVGEGAHGIVMKCRHKISGQVVVPPLKECFQLDPLLQSGGGAEESSPQETGGRDQRGYHPGDQSLAAAREPVCGQVRKIVISLSSHFLIS